MNFPESAVPENLVAYAFGVHFEDVVEWIDVQVTGQSLEILAPYAFVDLDAENILLSLYSFKDCF